MAEIMPHIRLSDSQAAPYALLPGDPARLDRIASHLTNVEQLAYNREYRSIKGFYQGVTCDGGFYGNRRSLCGNRCGRAIQNRGKWNDSDRQLRSS